MPNFFVGYVATVAPSSTPEEGEANRKQWQDWLANLGGAVVNPGTPLMNWAVVPGDATAALSGLTGYTVIKADDGNAALAMVKDCPFLAMGRVEVAQMMEM
jgi:hypothetical protein